MGVQNGIIRKRRKSGYNVVETNMMVFKDILDEKKSNIKSLTIVMV
jgi:hypothetical protein